ncbi:hypothetical protein B0H17DRAFT_1133335 [Mycena rosella]|uniref:F-box domain-containing protein n=1 Tax=Mycena rosella TaxID=1033263 RepID=A0AAD7DI01_MYCRO|nr:hypothetical protein B0H17DRAFT_1133335 [Mycena rosella]
MKINDLPVEVLTRCFRLLYGSFTEHPHHVYDNLVAVSNVCREWQAVSISDAFSWAHVYIDSGSDLAVVRDYVMLADDCALRVHVELHRPSDAIYNIETTITSDVGNLLTELAAVLETLLPRTTLLRLESASAVQTSFFIPQLHSISCPRLKTLEMNITSMELDHSPALFHRVGDLDNLCLQNTLYARITNNVFANLTALMIVDIMDTPVLSDFTRILRATPLLQFLRLEDTDCDGDEDDKATEISLQFLTHLQVGYAYGRSIALIARICAPSLLYLTLSHLTHSVLDIFVSNPPSWSAHVHYLAFPSFISTGRMLRNILELFPEIFFLDFSGMRQTWPMPDSRYPTFWFCINDVSSSAPGICPQLRHMVLPAHDHEPLDSFLRSDVFGPSMRITYPVDRDSGAGIWMDAWCSGESMIRALRTHDFPHFPTYAAI